MIQKGDAGQNYPHSEVFGGMLFFCILRLTVFLNLTMQVCQLIPLYWIYYTFVLRIDIGEFNCSWFELDTLVRLYLNLFKNSFIKIVRVTIAQP